MVKMAHEDLKDHQEQMGRAGHPAAKENRAVADQTASLASVAHREHPEIVVHTDRPGIPARQEWTAQMEPKEPAA